MRRETNPLYKTNAEYIQSCSLSELADILTGIVLSVTNHIIGGEVPEELAMLEYQNIVSFLLSECMEPDRKHVS